MIHVMGYDILTVRTPEEQDGRLYPVINDEANQIVLDELDGDVETLTASAMHLQLLRGDSKTLETMAKLREVDMDLAVTDSRFVIACEKWNKGEKYWGIGLGQTFAAIETKLSQMKANREARGTMMVGHVRYPWLEYVGYKPRKPLIWHGVLRLVAGKMMVKDDEHRRLFLDLEVPKSVDPAELAQSIVQRASHYWLEKMDVQDPAVRERFEELAEAPVLPTPPPKQFTSYQMPMYKYANFSTALPSGGSGQDVER